VVLVVLPISAHAFRKAPQLTAHYVLQKLLMFTVLCHTYLMAALYRTRVHTFYNFIFLMYVILQSTLLSRVELGNENVSCFHTCSNY